MRVTEYDPARAIPDLAGKVILITGATSGFGYQTVLHLAQHGPVHIAFTGRNRDAAAQLITQSGLHSARISFLPRDMTRLASVKDCTSAFLADHDRLDLFIANAAISEISGPVTITHDGYDQVWQTNYLAHTLMDCVLLPLMLKTAAEGAYVRILAVSSMAHAWTGKAGFNYTYIRDASVFSEPLGATKRYGHSKLGVVLRADEIARRYPALTVVSIHPGTSVHTPMNQKIGWLVRKVMPLFINCISVEQGAYNSLWAATAPRVDVESGQYYEPVGSVGKRAETATPEEAEKLWLWTEAELARWQ